MRGMKGDEFVRRVRECQGPLHSFLTRLLGDTEEAKEAMHTTILKAWESRNGFQGRSQFKTWLFRIAINVAKDMMRRDRGLVPLEDAPLEGQGPPDRLERLEEAARVREALKLLPERQRTALLLKVYGGLKYGEISKAMDLSEGAVKAHIHHALRKLREVLSRDDL